MKALILTLLLPSMMLIGCGQMETRQTSSEGALQGLTANGAITQEEAESINEDLLNEEIEMTEASPNSILMKVGGAELLVDFVENLTGASDEIAMIINGIEVTTQVAQDPQSFQGLIASLVSSQLEGREVFGLPLMDLVQMGLGLISGDSQQADFSNLFGTIVRGALNMFMASSPVGAIIGALAGPIIDNALGGGNSNNGNQNNNQNNNNQNNSGGGALGNIVNTIGGIIGGGNSSSPLGGILSLITNLFK